MLNVFVICSTYLISVYKSEWIESSTSTLPKPDYNQAIGIYSTSGANTSIFLLGGSDDVHQLSEYKITTDAMLDHSDSLSLASVYCYAQSYTQRADILYMKHPYHNQISVFNMKTRVYFESWIDNIPTDTAEDPCLASDEQRLFVVGGSNGSGVASLRSLQIYDLVNSTWLPDGPSMNTTRAEHSCIIHPQNNNLYAIGGYDEGSGAYFSSIEMIQSHGIYEQKWKYIDPLSQTLAFTRSVIYKHMILIIGGDYENENIYNSITVDLIHSINVLTNEVSVSFDALPLDLSGVAPVIVDNVLYVFGGFNDGILGAVNTVLIYDLSNVFPEPTIYETTATPNPILSLQSTEEMTSTLHSLFGSNATFISMYTTTTLSTNPISSAEAISTAHPIFDTSDITTTHTAVSPPHSDTLFIVTVIILICIIAALIVFVIYYGRYNGPGGDVINSKISIENVDEGHITKEEDIESQVVEGPVTNDIGQIVNDNDRVIYRRNTVDTLTVKVWLETEVNLSIYFDMFMNNGYDTLNIIKAIENEEELKEIGIVPKDHRYHILKEIKKLNSKENVLEITAYDRGEETLENGDKNYADEGLRSEDYDNTKGNNGTQSH